VDDRLTIGQVAERTGVATSALRFYEDAGLIAAERTAGNQRRYPRSVIRLVSVIKAGQSLGVPLAEIRAALARLPEGRVPTKRDWARMSGAWRRDLDRRIAELEALRAELGECIGCGCLSLRSCGIFNPNDAAASLGSGPRYLLGDEPLTSE
jgi:MerR family redox-sensitive transcriptional activator SoxR